MPRTIKRFRNDLPRFALIFPTLPAGLNKMLDIGMCEARSVHSTHNTASRSSGMARPIYRYIPIFSRKESAEPEEGGRKEGGIRFARDGIARMRTLASLRRTHMRNSLSLSVTLLFPRRFFRKRYRDATGLHGNESARAAALPPPPVQLQERISKAGERARIPE